MSDYQSLVLIVCILYLIECVLWLPDRAVIYRRSLSGAWSVAPSGWHLPPLRMQAWLAPLLPPFGRVIVTGPPPPFAPDPGGVLTVEGRRLLRNGKTVERYVSWQAAERAAGLLRKLAEAGRDGRGAVIEPEIRRLLATWPLRKKLALCRSAGRNLRRDCHAEFTLLCVGLVLVGWIGFRAVWLPFLVAFLWMGALTARDFHRAYRQVHGTGHPDRVSVTAMLVLSPLSAARAYDQLVAEVIGGFHPLAGAAVLCPKDTFRAEGARHLREWLYPAAGSDAEAAGAWFRECWIRGVEELIGRQLGEAGPLLEPPAKETEACRSFCPRCCCQYLFEEGDCADCRIPVLAYAGTHVRGRI